MLSAPIECSCRWRMKHNLVFLLFLVNLSYIYSTFHINWFGWKRYTSIDSLLKNLRKLTNEMIPPLLCNGSFPILFLRWMANVPNFLRTNICSVEILFLICWFMNFNFNFFLYFRRRFLFAFFMELTISRWIGMSWNCFSFFLDFLFYFLNLKSNSNPDVVDQTTWVNKGTWVRCLGELSTESEIKWC